MQRRYKLQVIWLGISQQIAKVGENEIQLSSARVRVSTYVIDLGFSIDNQLTMSEHIASICSSCHFQLSQLRAVRQSLSTAANDGNSENARPRLHWWAHRLLQQPAVWRQRQSTPTAPAHPKRGSTVGHVSAKV